MSTMACALTGAQNERIALSNVAVQATLHDLLCEVSVAQTYRNLEHVNIEAVYTFPLPLDAVLLELEVRLGARVLHGVVVEKKAAEARYEDALTSGDSAVMLEMLEPGLYTMNVGNLLAGESATITIRYAMLYRWSGDRLRVLLPTTIAPRYGTSRHLPHQLPVASLTVENHFSLQLDVRGSLREAQFTCPSHNVTLAKGEETTSISLRQERAVMDRDFVLQIRAPRAARGFAMCGNDGEGATVVASFQPFFSGLQQPRPLSLGLVIDCSGSMQGDSMQQAKRALDDILGLLEPRDQVTIVAFGNTTRAMSGRLLPCTADNLANARTFVRDLDANMGGTEVGNALHTATQIIGSIAAAELFLVTDGEVAEWESVVASARRTGHRYFTVGVGSAVAEAFVRGLASSTGGACELVSPGEGMSERIVRHFERMRAPRAARVTVRWPEGAQDVFPSEIESVFEGDTLVASARFVRPVEHAAVVLELQTEQGDVVRQELAIPRPSPAVGQDSISTIARIAAGARLATLDDAAARQTALRYRLTSKFTNWLVLAERAHEEKATEIPALRKVPQTLAAGWGGTGVHPASMARMRAASPPPMMPAPMPRQAHHVMDMPMFSLSEVRPTDRVSAAKSGGASDHDSHRPGEAGAEGHERERDDLRSRLVQLVNAQPSRVAPDEVIALLHDAGSSPEIDGLLNRANDAGVRVEVVAMIVLADLLCGGHAGGLSPESMRALAGLQAYTRDMWRQLQEGARDGVDQVTGPDGPFHVDGTASDRWSQVVGVLTRRKAKLRALVDVLRAKRDWAGDSAG